MRRRIIPSIRTCTTGSWRCTRITGAIAIIATLRAATVCADEPFDPVAAGQLPQYIFFNKSPTASDADRWDQGRPESFTRESIEAVVDAIGARGNDRLRVGVHFPFSILETEPKVLAKSIGHLLESAEAADVPVLITFDGQNWWESRSDLWNWWDPSLPGYSLANRSNVEWTDWGPEHAVKIGWRNWGQQVRVRPAPNIMSPKLLAEHDRAYDVLIPVMLRWYRGLPADRKYLFGGLKLGWEASINVNAYYQKDGNRIYDESPKDASKDPTAHDPAKGWTFGNPALGYAAVSTAGIRTSGTLTKDDAEKVVHMYLARLCARARAAGMPPHLIFTHQGGTMPPWDKHLSFRPAINDNSIPGWSFYWDDPPGCGSLDADMKAAGREQWAASEWWLGAGDAAGWQRRFESTLRYRQCRLICVYNWGPFAKDAAALEAVRQVVEAATTRPAPSTTGPAAVSARSQPTASQPARTKR